MKKSIVVSLLAAVLVFGWSEFSAQARWGVLGGINFSKIENVSLNRSAMTQFHVGATYQLKLPLGFSVQPSLLYNVKGAKLGTSELAGVVTSDMRVGYLELPVSVQWGPDLLVFRPFLDVTPYIGYGLHNKITTNTIAQLSADVKNAWGGEGLNRFEYGIGLGIGLEIWKVQLIGRYIWNLGSLYDLKTDVEAGAGQYLKDMLSNKNFGGFTLTAAILF